MAEMVERVLFLGRVHCYQIPPLTSQPRAADWKVDSPASIIFTARIRVIESAPLDSDNPKDRTTAVRLEDPQSGELFANGPYDGSYCVVPVTDSSRFFALRVVDGPRRAYLGIGFEDRSDSFDFGVCLQEVRRQNGLEEQQQQQQQQQQQPHRSSYAAGRSSSAMTSTSTSSNAPPVAPEPPKDYSLKPGETINITFGSKGRRQPSQQETQPTAETPLSLPFLAPPPTAQEIKLRNRQKPPPEPTVSSSATSATGSGFDDEFGDFV